MSTRSFIASMVSHHRIYCHNDGYPEHQLPILKEHYNTADKVEALLDLGDLSFLDARIAPAPGEKHSFDAPVRGVTIAYHRDRGESEKSTKARSFRTIKSLTKSAKEAWVEYLYVWDGSNWTCTKIGN